MTLLINLFGQSALRNFCLIFGISSVEKLAIQINACCSIQINNDSIPLYRFGNFDDQWIGNQ